MYGRKGYPEQLSSIRLFEQTPLRFRAKEKDLKLEIEIIAAGGIAMGDYPDRSRIRG